MKKLLFLLLALPMFAAAQEKPVQVPSCEAGVAFTIRIPIKVHDSITVQYAWYRNDTLIAGTEKMLLPNEKAIAYTVPDTLAYGSSVAYHFKYCLDDECSGVWTRSPRYVVNFLVSCPTVRTPGAVTFSAYSCSGGITSAGAVSFGAYSCSGGITSTGAVTFGAAN